MKYCVLLLGFLGQAMAQHQQYVTPVPILKQINKHNEDGSYSYGYEGADGSYKIESKYPTGEVYGKYGYVDDTGKLREIEYGASRRGFEPQGNDINVAPPTINNNYPVAPLAPNQEDDGQYREDPSIYYKNDPNNVQPAPAYQTSSKNSFGPRYTQPVYRQPTPQPTYQPAYQPAYQQPTYQPAYQRPTYQPAYQQPTQQPAFRPSTKFSLDDFISNRPQQQQPANVQPTYYNPPQPSYSQNFGGHYAAHPAVPNVDLSVGSYSVNYRRR